MDDDLDATLQEQEPLQSLDERRANEARVLAGRKALVKLRSDWKIRGEWTEYDFAGRQHLLVAAQHRRIGCLRCLRYNADGQQWQQQTTESPRSSNWTRID